MSSSGLIVKKCSFNFSIKLIDSFLILKNFIGRMNSLLSVSLAAINAMTKSPTYRSTSITANPDQIALLKWPGR